MKTAFITAEDIAEDLQISTDEAQQLIKWLAEEAVIDGLNVYSHPYKIPSGFYEKMVNVGFAPGQRARRLVSLEYLCRYLGIGQKRARRLAAENGWAVQVSRNVRYDLNAVDQWIDDHRKERG